MIYVEVTKESIINLDERNGIDFTREIKLSVYFQDSKRKIETTRSAATLVK